MRFRFENHELDGELRELSRDGVRIPLQPQVFDLLLFLVQQRDRLVSKDELIGQVWGDRAISDSALNSRINAARTAIGDDGKTQRSIRTIPRKGFRFVAECVEVSPAGQPAPVMAEPISAPAVSDRPAIAVLAFNNMSDDPDQDYFCDGISEDILTALSKVRWFLVIARNSSFTYKGRNVHIRQIAEELGVRYVVEGSVRKAGDRVRITAQLNDATTGSHLWAEHYDRDLVDVFAVQDEITNSIVAAIEPQIHAAENFRARRKPPASLDAWDLLMRGLSHYWRVTREDHVVAQALLAKIDRDRSELRSGAGGAGREPHVRRASRLGRSCDRRPRCRARRVLGGAARPRGCLGACGARQRLFLHAPAGDALSEFETALRMNPNFCLVQGYYALALSYAGRTEDSFEAAQRAIRLSPRDPSLAIFYGIAGYARFMTRQYDEAIALAREAIRHRGDLTGAYRVLAVSAGMIGDKETAVSGARGASPHPAEYFPVMDRDPASVAHRGGPRALSGGVPPGRPDVNRRLPAGD